MNKLVEKAVDLLLNSHYTTAFTGAGISVESGIPPFRGPEGLWSQYDPVILDISYFKNHPVDSWKVIKEIFYDFFGNARPNPAHKVLAEWEKEGLIQNIITQNIDNLHQLAGSKRVYEFHGNSQQLVCLSCEKGFEAQQVDMNSLPLQCSQCGGLLKPDFIFFGEAIPQVAYKQSLNALNKADLILLIGTTGEVIPAGRLPYLAKEKGAFIIEINKESTDFTQRITDIFLQGKASEVLMKMSEILKQIEH